jgi:prepilin-type N-terminal cleavage/methylation domain-containing protein
MCTQQVMIINENIGDRGFSILEVVFAISIFAIGILAVTTLSISAVNSNASSRRITDATALAEDRLERLAALPYDDIKSPDPDEDDTVGAYRVTWVVKENDMLDKTKTITVTVECPKGWKNTKVTISNLVSNNS